MTRDGVADGDRTAQWSRFAAQCRPSYALCSITQTDATSNNHAKRVCGLFFLLFLHLR